MKTTRRGLFGLGIGASLAALVGVGVHLHDWRKAPSFFGYECACGATESLKE